MAKREQEYKRLELFYQMLVHYLDRPYSDAELGELLGTDRSNVYRIRNIITSLEIPIEESTERGKYVLPRDFQMQYIHFSNEELAALYLGARRLQQQTRTSQQHVAYALRKLANAMRKPFAEGLTRAAGEVQAQEQNEQQQQIFSLLVQSWIEQMPIRIYHTKLHGVRRDYVVHPYHIEPSMWNDGNYLIGYSEYHDKIVRFKITRIDKAVVTGGNFREATDFDVHHFLEHAWGIWSNDEEPVTVRLRFRKWAIPRLIETVWPNATLTDPAADGSRVWEMPVAEWREMVPWVRSWGADVEVLGPVELREVIVADVNRLANRYKVKVQPPMERLLWAKTDSNGNTHPLVCHLIDVGQVAFLLWNQVLTDAFRLQIARALDLNVEAAGRLFAFWAACHDVGKACPNFQRKYEPAIAELKDAGFTFPTVVGDPACYHATISALVLPKLLAEETKLPEDLGWEVAQALGGHHGSWPNNTVRRQHRSQVGDESWEKAQVALLRQLIDLFDPPTVTRLGTDRTMKNTLLVLLSGLSSVADWMGSMSEYFIFSTPYIEPAVYLALAQQRAKRVLERLGWLDWQPPTELLDFQTLHGFAPRSTQATVLDRMPGEDGPCLVIAEMLTGSGKTELALALADRWAVLHRQRGLYVAMPTQATSNQMYGRVGRYLRKRYPEQQVNYHLIHSGAQWREDLPDLEFSTADETPQGTVKAQSWFVPRKRTLLAPFAVGTVDQALMSTLQTRHFFVRLFGLSGKTIIFDEVHAYDTYMNTLFQRLLVWLRAVGASVIILSATLPASTRRALVAAWQGENVKPNLLSDETYPCVTVASAHNSYQLPLPADGDERTITIEWVDHSSESIVAEIKRRLVDGGCVAIICNRVARAQELHRALADAHIVAEADLLLFHARTPVQWRNKMETTVLDRFGKRATNRPQRAIVVATQVIEQSLDLDFDLMATDLAPIDLILQRAGRLHRHTRDQRPAHVKTPTLLITTPNVDENSSPSFGSDGFIYEPYFLLRTLWTIQGNGTSIQLPAQTVNLIEAVYGEEDRLPTELPINASTLLADAHKKLENHERKAHNEAEKRLVAPPNHEDLLLLENDILEEENPEIHESLQAMTRLMRPTISLVCLHGEIDAAYVALDPKGTAAVDLNKKPSPDLVRELVMRVVTVSHPIVLHHFGRQAVPRGWKEVALLQNHRQVIFTDGEYHLGDEGYTLKLSETYGLEIVKG